MKYLNETNIRGQKFNNRQSNAEIIKEETNNKQQTPNNKQQTITNTSNAAKPLGAYPHARKVGDLLFLSGIGKQKRKRQ